MRDVYCNVLKNDNVRNRHVKNMKTTILREIKWDNRSYTCRS